MSVTQVSEQPIAGLVVYWNVQDCDYSVLESGFRAAGLAGCLEPQRSSIVALREAFLALMGPLPRTLELKPLKGREGYELVHIRRGHAHEGNQYTPLVRVYLDNSPLRQPRVVRISDASTARVPPRACSNTSLLTAFSHASKILGKHKVSRCLARAVQHLMGQPFRSKGGLYWLPPDALPQWELAAAAVAKASTEPVQVHAMKIVHDTASVAAVADAVAAEVAKECAKLAEGLDNFKTPVTAVKTKIAAADALLAKVRHYEKVLGTALTSVTESLEKTKLAAATAVLLAAAG